MNIFILFGLSLFLLIMFVAPFAGLYSEFPTYAYIYAFLLVFIFKYFYLKNR